jgi:hypothetical protein
MVDPIVDPRVPEIMKKQWESQVRLLPETLRPIVTGYIRSAYIIGMQHGYDRAKTDV